MMNQLMAFQQIQMKQMMMMAGQANPMNAMIPPLPQIPIMPQIPQLATQPPITQASDPNFLLICPSTQRFKTFMNFLLYLKTNLKEHQPCICMQCWKIVVKNEA